MVLSNNLELWLYKNWIDNIKLLNLSKIILLNELELSFYNN